MADFKDYPKKQLQNVLTTSSDHWGHVFGWDEKIAPFICQRYSSKYWKKQKEIRKPYLKTLKIIFRKLEEMAKRNSHFAIIIKDVQSYSLFNQINQEYQNFIKILKEKTLLHRFLGLARKAAVFGTAAYIGAHSLYQDVALLFPNFLNTFLNEILPTYEERLLGAGSLREKTRAIIDLFQDLWNLKEEYGEEVTFKFGVELLKKYAERMSKENFSHLSLQKNPPLIPEVAKSETSLLPKTLEDLLRILENEKTREYFINALIKNFYQIGTFRFTIENEFTYIPHSQLLELLNQLTDKIKEHLSQTPDKQQGIDSLNPTSEKKDAIYDWDEVIKEILKYCSPQLKGVIEILDPQPSVEDVPLKFTRKRSAYLHAETILLKIAETKMGLSQPAININNEKELESIFQDPNHPLHYLSYVVSDQQLKKLVLVLSEHFTEEEKWLFISWALSLAANGEIDFDLIPSFVDFNRIKTTLSNLSSQTKDSPLSKVTLFDGHVNAFSLISFSPLIDQLARSQYTRREFLKTLGVSGAAVTIGYAAHQINERFKSKWDVLDAFIQSHNGAIWEEVEQRLKPILTTSPHLMPETLVVKMPDGTEVGRYYEHDKEYLPIDQIPNEIIEILLAVEDRRFFLHNGADPIGIIRGFAFSDKSGGSTITQQLIRQFCFSQKELLQERGNMNLILSRKATEIIMALIFERKWYEYYLSQGYDEKNAYLLTKYKILEIYLNNAPFGPNTYGIKAAARYYFNKEPRELTKGEIAFLIGLLQNPVGYYPFRLQRYDTSGQPITTAQIEEDKITLNDAHPAIIRLKLNVLPLIQEIEIYDVKTGRKKQVMTPEEVEIALHSPIILHQPSTSQNIAYLNEVISTLTDNLGPEAIYSGLEIMISINPKLQKIMEEKICKKLSEEIINGAEEAAVVILEAESGKIIAAAGAEKKENQIYVNNGICWQENYPGSAVKPFTYARALAEGKLSPDATVTGNSYNGIQNAGGRNYGDNIPWKIALASSLNGSAQQVAEEIGANELRNIWIDLGLRSPHSLPLSKISANLTLGTAQVSPMSLAAAYACFINGGYLVSPNIIDRITTKNGNEITRLQPRTRIFAEEVADGIYDALSNPANKIYPNPQTWQPITRNPWQIANGKFGFFAKSGTETNPVGNQRAAWIAGGMIHPQHTNKKYIVVVYIGSQKQQGMSRNVWGIATLGDFWRKILEEILKEEEE